MTAVGTRDVCVPAGSVYKANRHPCGSRHRETAPRLLARKVRNTDLALNVYLIHAFLVLLHLTDHFEPPLTPDSPTV